MTNIIIIGARAILPLEVDYEITRNGEPEKGSVISQKSVASFIVEIIEYPAKHLGESLGINKTGS